MKRGRCSGGALALKKCACKPNVRVGARLHTSLRMCTNVPQGHSNQRRGFFLVDGFCLCASMCSAHPWYNPWYVPFSEYSTSSSQPDHLTCPQRPNTPPTNKSPTPSAKQLFTANRPNTPLSNSLTLLPEPFKPQTTIATHTTSSPPPSPPLLTPHTTTASPITLILLPSMHHQYPSHFRPPTRFTPSDSQSQFPLNPNCHLTLNPNCHLTLFPPLHTTSATQHHPEHPCSPLCTSLPVS